MQFPFGGPFNSQNIVVPQPIFVMHTTKSEFNKKTSIIQCKQTKDLWASQENKELQLERSSQQNTQWIQNQCKLSHCLQVPKRERQVV